MARFWLALAIGLVPLQFARWCEDVGYGRSIHILRDRRYILVLVWLIPLSADSLLRRLSYGLARLLVWLLLQYKDAADIHRHQSVDQWAIAYFLSS